MKRSNWHSSLNNSVDTLETTIRMLILFCFLFGLSVLMVYHFCYELIPRVFGSPWIGHIFGYYTTWADGVIPLQVLLLLILDVTIRDIIPILLIITVFLYGTIRIKSKYKLVPLSQYSPGTLARVGDITASTRIKKLECYVLKSNEPQAFVFGKNSDAKLVLTSGLLKLPLEEIKSVICHELGHILHKDVTFMTWGETFIGALKIYVPVLVLYEIGSSILGSLGLPVWSGPPLDTLAFRLLFVTVFLLIVPIALINSVSRTREFFADAESSITMESSEPLALALIEISSFNAPKKTRFPLRLTIAESKSMRSPKSKIRRIFSYFTATHPDLKTRLKSLMERKFVGRKNLTPNWETAVWIGLSVALLLGFLNEFRIAANDFLKFVGIPSQILDYSVVFSTLLASSFLICLFFCIFFRKRTFSGSTAEALLPYLRKASGKIAVAVVCFSVVYFPWVWWLTSPLLGWFENLPLSMLTLATPDPQFFVENIFFVFVFSYYLIMLTYTIVRAYYKYKSEKISTCLGDL